MERDNSSRSRNNWTSSITWQVDFYRRTNKKRRTDPEFPWALVSGGSNSPVKKIRDITKRVLHGMGSNLSKVGLGWLIENSELLWESRSFLNDELSKLLFDETLVLLLTEHRQFYFPRIYFDDLLEIVDEKTFHNADLPEYYMDIPLRIFDVRFKQNQNSLIMKIVTYREFVTLFNSYRQYFIGRNNFNISPMPGDTVLDCGACIGDTSLLFAGLVASKGEVHLFEPIPLHTRFCQVQAALNPSLAHVLHINQLAVSNITEEKKGKKKDSERISPGGLAIDAFSSTSLDDYASGKISRVDYIKMDIEGAEVDALEGATQIIREFKPRLAISAYHKPSDFWEIPFKLKSLNPNYKLYFGHHSPVSWESVFYAIQQ